MIEWIPVLAAITSNTVENLLVAGAVIGFIALCGKGLMFLAIAAFLIWCCTR